MHVRLLVAVPVLLILDHVFPRVCRSTLEQLVYQSFVPESAGDRFDRVLRGATRVADSLAPEVLLALLAFCLGIGALVGVVPTVGTGHRNVLTAAHAWYALADWPVLQFLLWRSLLRWAIWVRVLVGLSRIDLDLVPSHGDRRGGISFLRLPSIGYCGALLFAISSVLCADQVGRVHLDASLASFTPLVFVFATVGTLVAFGPLLLFSPLLLRVRRDALVRYSGLGTGYGRGFQRRWLDSRAPADQLQAGATQPLADLAAIYRDPIDSLRPLLFDRRDMIVLLVATLLPMVPVLLVHVPDEDWQRLIGILTGGALR
jgi:hypothetical protein